MGTGVLIIGKCPAAMQLNIFGKKTGGKVRKKEVRSEVGYENVLCVVAERKFHAKRGNEQTSKTSKRSDIFQVIFFMN